jgi:hypothetical protein
MGDWVAHPFSAATRRILVTCPCLQLCPGKVAQNLLASGWTSRRKACYMGSHMGSCKPKLGLQNPTEFILCPMIIIFPMLSPSTRGRLLQTKSAGSGSFVVSLQARNQVSKPSTKNGAYSMTTCSKIDDLRSRSMCVWYFAYLVMKIWPHCNLVLMYRWWL